MIEWAMRLILVLESKGIRSRIVVVPVHCERWKEGKAQTAGG